MAIYIKIEGNLARNSRKFKTAFPQQVAAAFTTSAWLILGDSLPITPMRDGILRSTQHVKPPVITRDEVKVEFGYGGPAAPYAWRVHELPESSNWTTPGTGPKYLEGPLQQRKPSLPGAWQTSMNNQVKSSFGS